MEGSEITLAAADGFRLAVHTLALSQEAPAKVEVIIPARAMRELQRLIGDQEEPIEMAFNANQSQVLFRLQNAEIVSQLIQGTFPKLQSAHSPEPYPLGR